MKKILLGLTTTPGSDWREKIKEIDELKIEEIAFFPTCLERNERQELYNLLEKTSLVKILFTHLREDMSLKEINYIKKHFGCDRFNIHSYSSRIAPSGYLEELANQFPNQIYVENAGKTDQLEEVASKFAGLCIDFAHWEAGDNKRDDFYKLFPNLVSKYKIGFAHISAVSEKPIFVSWDKGREPHYDLHFMQSIDQLDYLKKYVAYLPEILGIELENSFKEQLEVKKYLEEMIK